VLGRQLLLPDIRAGRFQSSWDWVVKSWPSPRLEYLHSGKSLGLGLDHELSARQIRTLPGWVGSLKSWPRLHLGLVLKISAKQIRTLPGWVCSLAKM
jgi:hypothetical protein